MLFLGCFDLGPELEQLRHVGARGETVGTDRDHVGACGLFRMQTAHVTTTIGVPDVAADGAVVEFSHLDPLDKGFPSPFEAGPRPSRRAVQVQRA